MNIMNSFPSSSGLTGMFRELGFGETGGWTRPNSVRPPSRNPPITVPRMNQQEEENLRMELAMTKTRNEALQDQIDKQSQQIQDLYNMMVNSPPQNSQERNIQDPFRPLSPPQQTFTQNPYAIPPINPYQQPPPPQFQQQPYMPNYLKQTPPQNPFFQNPTPPTNQYYRTAPPPPPPGSNYSYKIEEPKAKDPTPFDGKKTYEATQFIRSCQLVFMLQPIRYASERTKILYAISYLTDSPLSYFQTLLEQGTFDTWFPNWEAFKAHFMNHYGNPDAVRTADMKIRALRQT